MGVKIIERQYLSAFSSSLLQDWLLGNVGDWKRARFLIEASIEYIATQAAPISINIEEKTVKLMNGKKWSDYGFDTYGNVTMNYIRETTDSEGNTSTDPVSFTFNITQIYNDTFVYDSNSGFGVIGFEMIPTERANEKIYGVKIFAAAQGMQGAKISYNNIGNDEVQTHNLNSFIDGNITQGYGRLFSGQVNEMNLIGNQSGMAINKISVNEAYGTGGGEAVNANWNIPATTAYSQFNANSVNFINTALKANRNSYSIPAENITKNVAISIVPTSGTNYSNGVSGACFLYNSNIDELLYLQANINMTAVDTTNEVNPINIRLVLIKYKDGATLNFEERIVLQEWPQETFTTNVPLIYNNITPIGVQVGTSYAFTIEFSSGAVGQNINRKLDYKINSGTLNLMQDLGSGSGYKVRYWVEIDYMLASFFESLETFTTMQAPEVVFDANSLADVVLIELFPEWNNPNTSISTDPVETERLGNTGWFFENYNGLPNVFSVKELKYSNLLDAEVSSLSFGQETKVRAVITGFENNLVPGSTTVAYGFMWVPTNEDDYKNKTTPFHENTKINSPLLQRFDLGTTTGGTLIYEGFTATPGERMDVRNITIGQEGNDLVFEAIFKPTEELRQFFEARPEDRNYIMWLSVSDSTISNRVSLILDFNQMDLFIPISGELEGTVNRFLEHPEAEQYPGVDVYEGFLQDDILAKTDFKLDLFTRLNQIIFGYEVENTSTGNTYELDRFSANLNTFITTPSGRQEINFNAIRGYKLGAGNNKNWVKVLRNSEDDTNEYSSYKAFFATKIRWEDWIQRFNVSPEFYNNTLPFNGSENNWLDYLRAGSHKINFFMLFDINEDGTVNRYKNKFEITFQGYDENTDIITTEHHYYNNATGASLDIGNDADTGRPLGMLLSNQYTRIEILYTKVSGEWDINNVYAVTTIEVDKGAGIMEQRQLSSIWDSESDNILIPLPGNNGKLLVEQITPETIKTSCLVDYTKLTGATKYKISGRIGCFENENGIPVVTTVYDRDDYNNNYE